MAIQLKDLPARLQAQVAAQLYREQPQAPISRPPGATIRQNRGRSLNKLELAFLERLKVAYGQDRVLSQAMTLSLANGCTFRPDFMVVQTMTETGLVALIAFEVKGPHAWDDSIVKLKVAARSYGWIKFYLATRKKDGTWSELPVLP